jgi:hypothetical protein
MACHECDPRDVLFLLKPTVASCSSLSEVSRKDAYDGMSISLFIHLDALIEACKEKMRRVEGESLGDVEGAGCSQGGRKVGFDEI